MTGKLSVLLPCYNAEDYLFQTLESIDSQDYDRFELVFVNDGSTDSSLDIFESFVWREGIDVIIISQDNNGFLFSLLKGMKVCSGDIIARCDADDVWHSSHLQRGVQALTQNDKLVLVGSSARLIDGKGAFIGDSLRILNPKRYLLRDNPFIHSSVLFKRAAYEKLSQGYDSDILLRELFADYILFVRLSAIGDIRIFEKPSLDYRVLQNSMSRKYRKFDVLISRRFCIREALESSSSIDRLYGSFWLLVINLRIHFESIVSFWRK